MSGAIGDSDRDSERGREGGFGGAVDAPADPWRYARLLSSLARFTLSREMAFRGNFLAKITVEALWLGFLLVFYRTIFSRADTIADWTEAQYLFFVGCFFALNGVVETFFLDNCNEFAELIRTGDLDFLLVKPIDDQFLVSFRRMDWGTAPNILMGGALMGFALRRLEWTFDLPAALAFAGLFACGLALAYSFMLAMMSLSVWMVRNQSLMEMWWLCTNLARYPREIYRGPWGEPLGLALTFVVPFLLMVHVPASSMVRALEPGLALYTVGFSIGALWLSRRIFKRSLRSYRSASS